MSKDYTRARMSDQKVEFFKFYSRNVHETRKIRIQNLVPIWSKDLRTGQSELVRDFKNHEK